METFQETQTFRQWWVWLIMGFIALIFLSGLFVAGVWDDPQSLLGILPLGLVIMLLYVWRLDTRLDQEGVFPLIPWRTIPWSSVRLASVQPYGFVGYGIRLGFEGWVYNVAGDKGLRIIFLDKHQVTIGTQHPEEMAAFLANHPTLMTT